MSYPESKIQCSNPDCVASNILEARFCNRCRTPLVRRYLWSHKAIAPEAQNALINDRYLALGDQLFLDTQPGKPPLTPEEITPEIVVYLQLFPCYPHVPQAYGMLDGNDAWLFDYGTIPTVSFEELVRQPREFIPRMENLWSGATALQQLNWLWQIAKLWHPLSIKKVASSLLEPDLIRINGQVVQLLQLKSDGEYQASLGDLGNLWSQWAENSHSSVKDVIEQLAIRLEGGNIDQISQVIAVLDRAINYCSKGYKYSYQTYALSDSGPRRDNNEDAAYPTPSFSQAITSSENTLAIVCDGVGGHEGGEIASNETIEYLRHKISQLNQEEISPRKVLSKLAKYINGANDIINQRNNNEQRQERQRMGTTLVIALSYAQKMFLGHVGDSRIYWITRHSCHQVTVDDDLASREVRLGYALYQDSLQYPSAGALVQAIGMRDSAALHPNLRHFVIDNDCIFLLCSDGLSDFDRVEQQWQQTVVPVLAGEQDLASAVKDLVALANEKNGHDNVTVALVHGKVSPTNTVSPILWSDVEYVLKESVADETNLTDSLWASPNLTDTSAPKIEILEQQIGEPVSKSDQSQSRWLLPVILLLIISTVAGLFAYYQLQDSINEQDSDTEINQLE